MLLNTIDQAVSNLFPGYFALVMATGIVSVASFLIGFESIAMGLLYVNVVAYGVLWILTIARMMRHLPRMLDNLTNHESGAGFFTIVAGTCVLGTQFVTLVGRADVAQVLWWIGLGLWIIIMFVFFTSITVREVKPSLESAINGAWLLAIVATQSVSILATHLASGYEVNRPVMLFFALCMYMLGSMLYVLIITLIFYRFTFFRLTMAALTPPYWINMGAVAITTLAGCTLILNAEAWPVLLEFVPFLRGFTLFFWATATWWIPLLFILGAWRHLYKRYPIEYDPQYWGMVFPLGMYTACTHQLARALHVPFLDAIPGVFIYVALVAWMVTFIGLMLRLVSMAMPVRSSAGP